MSYFPTLEELDSIEQRYRQTDGIWMQGDPMPPAIDDVPQLVQWCRNLLTDREVAKSFAGVARADREGMGDRIRSVADLTDKFIGHPWAHWVRLVLRGDATVTQAEQCIIRDRMPRVVR